MYFLSIFSPLKEIELWLLNKWIFNAIHNISKIFIIFVDAWIDTNWIKLKLFKLIYYITFNGVSLKQEIKRDNWNIFDDQPWFIIKFSFV